MTFEVLHRLIKKSDVISLRRELDTGVSPNLSNQFSWTLLMLAAIEGNRSIGELLISKGADVNAINDFGETALSLAAHGGHIPFIRALLASGASTDCHPHGTSLGEWLRVSSGLPQDKIASVLDLISSASS
jgi:ankyrin repeat protein